MKTKNKIFKKKKRDVVIDADHILYYIASKRKDVFDDDSESIEDDTNSDTVFEANKNKFKETIEEYVKTAEVECVAMGWEIKKVRVVFSDSRYFRHELYPEYKAGRSSEKTQDFIRLRDWAKKKYAWFKNYEADDIVGYYVHKKGAIGFSSDKDLLHAVEGVWYDTYHNWWVYTEKDDADRFLAMQTLAGDAGDNVKGIPRVGLRTAEKLLDGDYSWTNVVAIYKYKGLTEKDAIFTRRLVDMKQVEVISFKKREAKLHLFTP